MPPEMVHIAKLMNFTGYEIHAFEILVNFENETPPSYCRRAIEGYIQNSLDKMNSTAQDESVQLCERARYLLDLISPYIKDRFKIAQKAASKPSSQPVPINESLPLTAIVDVNLWKETAKYSPEKCRAVAVKLARWADELKAYADQMDGKSVLANVN
jgi:hypothetical protein